MMYHRDPRSLPTSITIRAARGSDESALRHLAQRDTRPLPDGELLVALVDDEPRAAISLTTGEVIADPFHRTEDLVRMLALRFAQMHRGLPTPRRGLRRLRLTSS
jgi:hypothetical protein